MTFTGINYFAVAAAAAATFAFGALWYSLLSKRWMAAARVTPEMLKAGGGAAAAPFAVAIVSNLLMAYLLAGLMGHLDRVDITGGLGVAFFVWLGFVVTTMAVNHRFQNQTWMLTVIDSGYWLCALLLQAFIIGLIGVS